MSALRENRSWLEKDNSQAKKGDHETWRSQPLDYRVVVESHILSGHPPLNASPSFSQVPWVIMARSMDCWKRFTWI